MPRDDGQDDNPFSSSGYRDDGSRDGGSSDGMNDTIWRMKLRKVFNGLILEDVIGPEDHRNGSFGDGDGCFRRYGSCLKNALRNVLFLKALDGKCCRMKEDPQRFAQKLKNITREFHCPRGTKFCPFRFMISGQGCIPEGKNCSATFGNHSEPHWTPWGSKSRKDRKYCDILKTDIPKKMPCSYHALIKWMTEMPESVTPSGKPCPPGARFCPSTFDCRPKAQGCDTEELTRWASKILCRSSQRLCVECGIHCRLKEERCPREANMSKALREAALTLKSSTFIDLCRLRICYRAVFI